MLKAILAAIDAITNPVPDWQPSAMDRAFADMLLRRSGEDVAIFAVNDRAVEYRKPSAAFYTSRVGVS